MVSRHMRSNSVFSSASVIPPTFRLQMAPESTAYDDKTEASSEAFMEQVFLEKADNQWETIIKMVSIVLLPIVALIAITSVSLRDAILLRENTMEAKDAMDAFLAIDTLVTNLQIERGTSATFLSSGGVNIGAHDRLLVLRQNTDISIFKIIGWPQPDFISNASIANASEFLYYLNQHRFRVDDVLVTVTYNVEFYTIVDKALMDWGETSLLLPERGDLWQKVVATAAMLSASDAIGIQRALGSTFFTTCGFEDHIQRWFINLEGEQRQYLNFAWTMYAPASLAYETQYVGSDLEETIDNMTYWINFQDLYRPICEPLDEDIKYNNSFYWFNNFTVYIVMLKKIRESVITDIVYSFEGIIDSAEREVAIYSMVMTGITILSIGAAFWYARSIYTMTSTIVVFATTLREKSKDIKMEKKRTETLLYQMLPKSVADQLKTTQEVKPEFFEMASLYFSDIVGFTRISSQSQPMQVVQLLNKLYSTFDTAIDKYDAYKVETIGDAYMVVSGVPEVNDNHAEEIALLSLDLVDRIKHFTIPHRPNQKLQIRIGLHTGAVVAGVVGSKMPRYCLFGDNVDIASKLESTGPPGHVHISEITHHALQTSAKTFLAQQHDGLYINNVKGRRLLKSYLLLGVSELHDNQSGVEFVD